MFVGFWICGRRCHHRNERANGCGVGILELKRIGTNYRDELIASSTFIVGKELTPQPIPFQQHETSAPREVGASVV
jgi:hypothetical protein